MITGILSGLGFKSTTHEKNIYRGKLKVKRFLFVSKLMTMLSPAATLQLLRSSLVSLTPTCYYRRRLMVRVSMVLMFCKLMITSRFTVNHTLNVCFRPIDGPSPVLTPLTKSGTHQRHQCSVCIAKTMGFSYQLDGKIVYHVLDIGRHVDMDLSFVGIFRCHAKIIVLLSSVHLDISKLTVLLL